MLGVRAIVRRGAGDQPHIIVALWQSRSIAGRRIYIY